jgi:transcriptional regulator with XRE-family HTH domain
MADLQTLRKEKGLTALQLARAAGTFEPRIYAFERQRFSPNYAEGVRIAEVLGIPLADLFPRLVEKRTILVCRTSGRTYL